jgi:hypothetical protein
MWSATDSACAFAGLTLKLAGVCRAVGGESRESRHGSRHPLDYTGLDCNRPSRPVCVRVVRYITTVYGSRATLFRAVRTIRVSAGIRLFAAQPGHGTIHAVRQLVIRQLIIISELPL